MARPPASTLLTALGLTLGQGRLYDRLTRETGRSVGDVARALAQTTDQLLADLEPLRDAGLVTTEDSRLLVVPPSTVIAEVLGKVAEDAARSRDLLADVAAAVPYLARPAPRATGEEVDGIVPVDGELTSGGDVPALLQRLLDNTVGEVRWLRPAETDPVDEGVLTVVDAAVAGGRPSRVIYPVRAWQHDPEGLLRRLRAGEQVRLVADVPTRMMLVGTSHAMLTEPLGFHHEPRSLLRQRGVVQALGLWFDAMWRSAAPVPATGDSAVRADQRRFLLEQLVSGAQDEQIARRLGVSLRTVRRRVAEAMAELGAETRFQAGAEAVRRGWL